MKREQVRPPGLYDTREVSSQVVDVEVASAAIHSKSEGWLPAIVLTIGTDDGGSFKSMLVCREGVVEQIAQDLLDCRRSAILDVATARPETGRGKTHGASQAD